MRFKNAGGRLWALLAALSLSQDSGSCNDAKSVSNINIMVKKKINK